MCLSVIMLLSPPVLRSAEMNQFVTFHLFATLSRNAWRITSGIITSFATAFSAASCNWPSLRPDGEVKVP